MSWMRTWMMWMMGVGVGAAVPLKVSALHPLMADLAKQVGGERVEVVDLVGEGGNPHRFEPRPADLKRMQSSVVVLAAGKHLEPYLERLRSTLSGVTVVEVGQTIPSLDVGKSEVDGCCPGHEAGAVDPHWWHGIDHMRRAARVVSQALAEKDPEGKQIYQKNAIAYGQRLERLKKWAKVELMKVPMGQRKLVTGHHSFAYFGKEFGYETIAVAGLNKEQNTTPQEQAETIEAVKKTGVVAVFPDQNSGSKTVAAIVKATGAKLAEPLISDGNGVGKDAGFEGMIRHNVTVIVRALGAP